MAGENVISTIRSWIGGISAVAVSLLGLAISTTGSIWTERSICTR